METNKCKDQIHTDNYSIFNADCVDVISDLPVNSIDLPVFILSLYAKSIVLIFSK